MDKLIIDRLDIQPNIAKVEYKGKDLAKGEIEAVVSFKNPIFSLEELALDFSKFYTWYTDYVMGQKIPVMPNLTDYYNSYKIKSDTAILIAYILTEGNFTNVSSAKIKLVKPTDPVISESRAGFFLDNADSIHQNFIRDNLKVCSVIDALCSTAPAYLFLAYFGVEKPVNLLPKRR